MATVSRLEILRVRNLSQISIQPGRAINILFGPNGSGKTSLLESLHLLGSGRSFRSAKIDPLIMHGCDDSVIFSELSGGETIGLAKSRSRGHVLKLIGERQKSWVDTARLLPVQLINADSFLLLEGGPKIRRRFLDWGVFHVEHEFASLWRSASRIITQRNLLLKQHRVDKDQIRAWDEELVAASARIDSSRRDYMLKFIPALHATLAELISLPDLQLSYVRGWDESTELSELLQSNLEKDIRFGATQSGPHRAEILIRCGRLAAADVLSRGQIKLLVIAMKISQGKLLSEISGRKCIYLIDDLPSELDRSNLKLVCEQIERLGCQVLLTAVDKQDLEKHWSSKVLPSMFHVEHGKITAIEKS